MEEKWLELAELFGDAFLELIEGEHTVTITLAKNKLERVKNLLEKHLQEDIKNEKKRQSKELEDFYNFIMSKK